MKINNANSILPHTTFVLGNANIIYNSIDREGIIVIFEKNPVTPIPTIEPTVTPVPTAEPTSVLNRIKIPVLMYHEIVDGVPENMYQMSLYDFK